MMSSASVARVRGVSCALSAAKCSRAMRMLISSVVISDLEALQGFRREQLFGLEAAAAHALLESVLQESLQGRAVSLDAVRPEILARRFAPASCIVRQPGHRRGRGADLDGARQAQVL